MGSVGGSAASMVAGTGLIGMLNQVVSELGAEDARFLPASAQQEDLIELQRAAERLAEVEQQLIRIIDAASAKGVLSDDLRDELRRMLTDDEPPALSG